MRVLFAVRVSLVHDLDRRFARPHAGERHPVRMSFLVTVGLAGFRAGRRAGGLALGRAMRGRRSPKG